MYQEGTEVIFACGGSVGKSVMAAAAEAGAKVIGVDVDQRYDSETVITSAMKGLGASVKSVLASIYDDTFAEKYAGNTTYFTAANNGVGLPTTVIGGGDAFDRFNSFDKAAYDAVFATIADGTVDPIRTIDIEDANGVATAFELIGKLQLTLISVVVR